MAASLENAFIQWDDHPMIRFRWLNKWMLYLMCLPETAKNTHRSPFCILMSRIIHITICLISAAFTLWQLYSAIDSFIDHNEWMMYYLQATVVWIIFCISGALSSFYFHCTFNYPWNKKMDVTFVTQRSQNFINTHHKQIILSCIVLSPCILICGILRLYQYGLIIPVSFWYILWIFGVLCINLRAVMIWTIHCVICIKYHNYLYNMIKNIDEYDLKQLLIEYQTISNCFRSEYVWSLKWSIWLFIISILVVTWAGIYLHAWLVSVFYLIEAVAGLIKIIVLYVIPGYLLSEKYDELQKLLWIKFNSYVRENNDIEKQIGLNSLIMYTTKYPVQIKFGPLKLTRRNTLVFAVAFVGSKIAAVAVSTLF